jgi:hypothetical protein
MELPQYKHYNCRRCGACCVYFAVMNEGGIAQLEPVFKHAGEVCRYMEYNPKTKQTSCGLHDKRRPAACDYFFCDMPEWQDKETQDNLAKIRVNLEEYIRNRETLSKALKTLQTSLLCLSQVPAGTIWSNP